MTPVHFTQLKMMALSPAHYRAACDEPSEPTPAMRFGSLVHHVYADEPVMVFDGERRGNAWKEFLASHEGVEIYTRSEHDRAQRCADALRNTPHAVEVLAGRIEHRIEWSFLGRKCSSRLDVLADEYVTDLKTASSAEPGRFGRACLGRFAYHAQLAFYLDAARHAGHKPREAYIVAVEPQPPFAVTVFRLTQRAIEEGAKLCRLWFERLLVCEASDEWPSYCQSVLDLDADADVNLIIDGEELAA